MEKYQTILKRIIALILDGIFTIVPFSIIAQYTNIENESVNNLFILSKTFLPFIYFILMNYLFGQTLGKMVVSIRIVDVSETRKISFKQAIIRESIWIGLGFIDFIINKTFANTSWRNVISLFDLIIIAFIIGIIIATLKNEKRRAIHDIIAA
jgi:uncharacterized RDD family membrane protein YckC